MPFEPTAAAGPEIPFPAGPAWPGTPEFGEGFETYLMHELASCRDYVSGQPLSYWRSSSGFEVDFLIGDHTAVEAKAKKRVSTSDLRSLRALAEERLPRLPGTEQAPDRWDHGLALEIFFGRPLAG